MPTHSEVEELINNCTWEIATYNGVNGQLVTGPNGNSIFLPAAGDRDGAELGNRGSGGYYWSGTLIESNSYSAYFLLFDGGAHSVGSGYREGGRTVRPVYNVDNFSIEYGNDSVM
jgi:hypothetical protein